MGLFFLLGLFCALLLLLSPAFSLSPSYAKRGKPRSIQIKVKGPTFAVIIRFEFASSFEAAVNSKPARRINPSGAIIFVLAGVHAPSRFRVVVNIGTKERMELSFAMSCSLKAGYARNHGNACETGAVSP